MKAKAAKQRAQKFERPEPAQGPGKSDPSGQIPDFGAARNQDGADERSEFRCWRHCESGERTVEGGGRAEGVFRDHLLHHNGAQPSAQLKVRLTSEELFALFRSERRISWPILLPSR